MTQRKRWRPTKWFIGLLAVGILLTLAKPAYAPAPQKAIIKAALIIAKVEPDFPPNYPNTGFLDRAGLLVAMIEVIRLLVDLSLNSPSDWCPAIEAVQRRSGDYFDLSVIPNPTLDQFIRDIKRLHRAAGCPRPTKRPR